MTEHKLMIENYLNNINTELKDVYDFTDEETGFLDSQTLLFVNDKNNHVLLGTIANYYGDVQICDLINGDFGYIDLETHELEKWGTIKPTQLMHELNNYLLNEFDYDNLIEHF